MRRLVCVLCAVLLAGCAESEQEDEMAADSVGMEPVAAGLTEADLNGTWNVRVMPEDRDTVLTTYELMVDAGRMSIRLPGNDDPIPVTYTIMGDSVVTQSGPFQSAVRAGVSAKGSTGVFRLQNGMLVGRTTAHYDVATPDSVVTFRTEGTRG